MTPPLLPGEIEQASLPTSDQTLNAHIAFSFARTPVERGTNPAARDLRQVSEVRRICGAKLRRWGLQHCVEPVLLLLSELVTNAIWHGSGHTIGVRLSYNSGELRIEAWGGPVSALAPRAPDVLDENGRGLLLVEAIADAWGIDEAGWVWCVMTGSETG